MHKIGDKAEARLVNKIDVLGKGKIYKMTKMHNRVI